MTLFIINPMQDIHCDHMISLLNKKGIEYVEFGSFIRNDYTYNDGQLMYNGQDVLAVHAPRGAYFRSVLNDSSPPQEGSLRQNYIHSIQFQSQNECIKTWLLLLHEHGLRVINRPRNFSKYYQLYTLQQAKIHMPRTCITSSPEMSRDFIRKVKRAVCKPLSGGSHCIRVTSEIIEQLDLITNEPVIFQEEIDGEDIRVNMLNETVISSHIILKDADLLDYRTDPKYDAGMIEYAEIQIPTHIRVMCQQAMRLLGLRFSGIDLRKTAANEWFLIECNSMPAYLDIERKTGAPITDALITDLLGAPSPPIEKTTQQSAPTKYVQKKKSGTISGQSLFDYYSVWEKWATQKRRKEQRLVVPLNEQQRRELHEQTGTVHTKMEIEYRGGEMHVVQIW